MGITERKVCDNMRLIDADAIEYTHAVARNMFDGHNWNELVVTKDEIEDMPTIQPEITHEQAVAYLQSTGWMQEHDRQMMLDGVHRLTAQPEPHWIPVTKEEMFKAGYDGREIIFKVDGRLSAIRELAQ